MRYLMTAILAAMIHLGSMCGFASASEDCCTYKKVVCEETITIEVIKEVSYTKEVVKYDYCGKPYTVCVTCYQEVKVPAKKTITVVKWVKVCS